jgi:hypothetical protein
MTGQTAGELRPKTLPGSAPQSPSRRLIACSATIYNTDCIQGSNRRAWRRIDRNDKNVLDLEETDDKKWDGTA